MHIKLRIIPRHQTDDIGKSMDIFYGTVIIKLLGYSFTSLYESDR